MKSLTPHVFTMKNIFGFTWLMYFTSRMVKRLHIRDEAYEEKCVVCQYTDTYIYDHTSVNANLVEDIDN